MILSVCFASFHTGCNLIDPAEPIPALVKVNPVVLEVEPGQGSARHKITEVWVSAEMNHIGVYRPGVTIPFQQLSAQTDFVFRPGIRNNGVLDDAIVYPLYTNYEAELQTVSGQITEVTPVFRYRPEAVFSFIEDFENSNQFVENRDTIAGTMLIRSSDEPFEGAFSGEILMTETNNYIEVTHPITLVDLPTDGTAAYLEVHYKSEAAFGLGLIGIPLAGQPVSNIFYVVFPSDEWNKLYLELSDQLRLSDFPAYKIVINSLYPVGETDPELRIQIDNLKVVHL